MSLLEVMEQEIDRRKIAGEPLTYCDAYNQWNQKVWEHRAFETACNNILKLTKNKKVRWEVLEARFKVKHGKARWLRR